MTDSDRERKRLSKEILNSIKRMRSSSKEMLTSAIFKEKYKDYRLVLVCYRHDIVCSKFLWTDQSCIVTFMMFANTGVITADSNTTFCCCTKANNKGMLINHGT